MRTRTFIALGLSVAAHALLVTGARSRAVWDRDLAASDHVLLARAADYDEVIVLEQIAPPPVCEERAIEEMGVVMDPVIKDAKVSDHNETDNDTMSLGDPRFDSDAPFAGPGTNGTIGIGGGSGGAFGGRRGMRRNLGGRRGGRRNLRAGGGGRASSGLTASIQPGLVAKIENEAPRRFPLTRTAVDAEASAWLATTKMTQTYSNPLDRVVEAVYTMPLPADAAVTGFAMKIGDRRVLGIVKPREQAEQIYAEARSRGLRASLMTQERPNLFTQSVANIAPGTSIDVEITYFHKLRYDGGSYEYVLPLVVMPRYMPGGPTAPDARASDSGDIAGGGGTHRDTDQVPDASRVSPPTLREGIRAGRDLMFDLSIDAGVTLHEVTCKTHDIDVKEKSASRAHVRLSDGDLATNGDLIVRWRVADKDFAAGFVAHRGDRGGFFSAFLIPPLDPRDAETAAREMTFVLDTSGSMNGVPIQTSQAIVERVLREARTYDRFNIIRFAGSSGSFRELPVDCTPENVTAGIEYVKGLTGSGGTEMLSGLAKLFDQPSNPNYARSIAFLTDGAVGNEAAILATIKDKGAGARWYAFGIGSSVNRYLIEGIAEHGGGEYEVVGENPDEANAAAGRMIESLGAPFMTEVSVDTNGLPVHGVRPGKLRHLSSTRPLVVFGRYDAAVEGELVVRGRAAGREVAMTIPLTLPEGNRSPLRREPGSRSFGHRSIKMLWASGRTRICGRWSRAFWPGSRSWSVAKRSICAASTSSSRV